MPFLKRGDRKVFHFVKGPKKQVEKRRERLKLNLGALWLWHRKERKKKIFLFFACCPPSPAFKMFWGQIGKGALELFLYKIIETFFFSALHNSFQESFPTFKRKAMPHWKWALNSERATSSLGKRFHSFSRSLKYDRDIFPLFVGLLSPVDPLLQGP